MVKTASYTAKALASAALLAGRVVDAQSVYAHYMVSIRRKRCIRHCKS